MTPDEWQAIVEWIDQRFTKGWHPEQAVAYYEDLERFDASDVWSALYYLYDQGRDFPPTGSKLRARTLTELQMAAERDRYDHVALPEPAVPGDGFFATLYPGERVSGMEHIRRWHAKHQPNCTNPACDIHHGQA